MYTKEYVDIKYDYEMKCKVLYEKISDIIKGTTVVSVSQLSPEDVKAYEIVSTTENQEEVGIPEYWLHAMDNSRYFYSTNDKDREILKFCDDITLEINNNKVVNKTL